MYLKLFVKFFISYENLNIFYCKSNNKLYIKGNYGIVTFYMPFLFFFKKMANKFSYLFLNKYHFFTVLKLFRVLCESLYKIYFFKLKLKGLGYRIKRVFKLKKLYRFFFAYKHYFYFHVPKEVIVRHKKRLIIFVAWNKQKLNDIFANFTLLKKMDFYERTKYFRPVNKIIFRKRKK